ncbi:hypothetical protein LQR31_22635, partial [Chromobacterium vaccinii]|uniref:RHS repeat domain-containing protein n=1 Tax=Chromobacterium vaccinii TaxID=1108595 RepID=UPI001E46F104
VVVDPDGLKLTTAYDYDAQGKKVRVTEAANTAQAKVTEYEYDGAGRRIRETVDPQKLSLSTRYGYDYDGNGNVTAKTDAAGNVTRYVYDGNDRLRYSVDSLGQVTEQRYDAAGNVTDTVRYATAIKLDGLDQALKASDLTARLKPSAQDQTTRTVYDAAGRQSYAVNAAGAVTQYEYDAAGNVTVRRELANRVPMRGVKIKNADGRIHDIVKYMGSFSAGDVVTATVRCKAPAGLKNDVFLGNAAGPNPYDNAVSQTVAGDDGWHTVTLTQKMTQIRDMEVLLYNLVQSGDAQAGVIYADLRVSSAQRGEVLAEAFERFDPAAKGWVVEADFEPVLVNLSQSGDASQLAAFLPTLSDSARDRVTRYVYDAAGRQSYVVNAAGAVTQYEYDAAGNVTVKRELANQVPTRGVKIKNADGRIHDIVKYMGSFSAGDVVTATVRCKAPAGLKNDVFLGNAAGPNPYDNAVSQTVAGDDGWHTVTLTQKMTQTRDMEVLLYNLVQSGDAQAGVIYADLRVSSAQRGEVLAEAFEKFDPAAKGWVVEADFEPVLVNLSQSGDASQLAAFLPTLSDPARDRVTMNAYDATGRLLSVSKGDGISQAQTVRY